MSSVSSSWITILSVIQREMTRYVYALFLIFGVTGCCLNILLLFRRQFRTLSCCTYFLGMSVFILVYIIWISSLYLYALNNVNPNITILAICKLRIYILQFTGMAFRWCLTAACFDRYALSSVNARLRNLARVHIARRVVALITGIWLVLPLHGLIFYNLKGTACGIVYSSAAALYHSIFTAIAGSILPVPMMVTCAILMYRNLILKQERRRQLNGNQQKRNPRNRKDYQILAMLLVQVLIYTIAMIPVTSFYFYNAATFNVVNKSLERVSIERFLFFLAEIPIVFFPVSSFYLYTISSSMFRAELKIMIRDIFLCKYRENVARVAPTMNTNYPRTTIKDPPGLTKLPPSLYFNRGKSECVNIVDRPLEGLRKT